LSFLALPANLSNQPGALFAYIFPFKTLLVNHLEGAQQPGVIPGIATICAAL